MRAQVFAGLLVIATITGLCWFTWQIVMRNVELEHELASVESALENTAKAMQQLDSMYRAADQVLADNRQRHDQINQQLREQIHAIRSDLAAAECAAADLPVAAAVRLRSITDQISGAGDTDPSAGDTD